MNAVTGVGLRAAGVHPQVASERLGYATLGVTLDLYTQAVQGLDADAPDRMQRALSPQPIVPPGRHAVSW